MKLANSLIVSLVLLAVCGAGSLRAKLPVRVGADRILEEPFVSWFRGKRVGLITNQTGLDSGRVSTIDGFRASQEFQLVALFGPEHGLTGAAQAGEKVESRMDVYSLYGEHRAPSPEMLRNVDVLVYDIQDVGARFYTYISTMFESMKAAARHEIPFVVLDRPNPIGGDAVAGPVLEEGFQSFVGAFSIPVRYGMTAGELARMLREQDQISVDLRVVPMENWQRGDWYDRTGLLWVPPSPNMPTLETATVYPGMCWIEGTNLSEGRGTTRPFELIGAPWMDAAAIADSLNRQGLPGVFFRQQEFTPTFSKFAGESAHGLQIHVLDRDAFDPFRTVLTLLAEVRSRHPDEFEFRATAFDRLAGNSWVRQMLTSGESPDRIIERWEPELTRFRSIRMRHLIYP